MGTVARASHPGRTVVSGALLVVAAMIGATIVWEGGLPAWAKGMLLVLALLMAITGWLLTFRDLSTPPPRSRRRSR
jgi:hypothetical protein